MMIAIFVRSKVKEMLRKKTHTQIINANVGFID